MPSEHGAEWHAKRARAIGSSEIAALYGVQEPYQMGLYALWHVKAGLIAAPPVGGPRVTWGTKLEAVIAEAAAEQEGWTIRKGEHATDPTTPGLGCTVDYVIEAPADNDEDCTGPGVLECKNTDWLTHKKKWVGGEPPVSILLQHQHQMACGYSWGVMADLVGGNELKIYRYKARPALIADIRARVTEFWASIAQNRPPPIDGSESAFYALREMIPEVIDDSICLDDDNRFPVLCSELAASTEARKEAEALEKTLKAELEQKLGEHKRAWGSGWAANFVVNGGSKGTLVTPEMVGTYIGGRKAFRFVNVKEIVK